MFGCVVAGRLLQTGLTQVDETHAYFELPAAEAINHVCVFLLGTVPCPDGYGATVHFFWPGKGFQLLGMLSNEKPSAIFRLRGTFSSTSGSAAHLAFSNNSTMADGGGVTAILGLAIEPLPNIATQMSGLPSALTRPAPPVDATALAERIVRHLFNYLAGFAADAPGADAAVPLAIVRRWYEGFLAKVRAGGVGFLERDES